MQYIYKEQSLKIDWTIYRNATQVKEGFEVGNLRIFLLSKRDRRPIEYTQNDGVISIEFEGNTLDEGVYSLKAIWMCKKNEAPIISVVPDLFGVTEHLEEATNPAATVVTLKTRSMTVLYWRDGLDAYERAVMLGMTTLSEKEWVYNADEVSQRMLVVENDFDGIKAEYNGIRSNYALMKTDFENIKGSYKGITDDYADMQKDYGSRMSQMRIELTAMENTLRGAEKVDATIEGDDIVITSRTGQQKRVKAHGMLDEVDGMEVKINAYEWDGNAMSLAVYLSFVDDKGYEVVVAESQKIRIPKATTTKAGLMSADDKKKLEVAVQRTDISDYDRVKSEAAQGRTALEMIENGEVEGTIKEIDFMGSATPYADKVEVMFGARLNGNNEELISGDEEYVAIPLATDTRAGVMGPEDKKKVDKIDDIETAVGNSVAKSDLEALKKGTVLKVVADELLGDKDPEYQVSGTTKGLKVMGAHGVKTYSANYRQDGNYLLIVDGKELDDKISALETRLAAAENRIVQLAEAIRNLG